VWAPPPFCGGAGSPSNRVAWDEAYFRAKYHLDPFDHNKHGQKIWGGEDPPLLGREGERSPHRRQSPRG